MFFLDFSYPIIVKNLLNSLGGEAARHYLLFDGLMYV